MHSKALIMDCNSGFAFLYNLHHHYMCEFHMHGLGLPRTFKNCVMITFVCGLQVYMPFNYP